MSEPKEIKTLLSKFYLKEQEGLENAKEALEETFKIENNGSISRETGRMDRNQNNSGIRTLGNAISTEFIRKGYIDLRGKKVRSSTELAVIAQVFRDPRYETLRFIYMKRNEIVGYEGITSKLPSSAVAFLNMPEASDFKTTQEFERKVNSEKFRFIYELSNRMNRLNADGYYLIHNHPSGTDVKPSKQDIQVTKIYQDLLKGFKGHIIIDSNKFSLIDKRLQISEKVLNLGEDKMFKTSIPHHLLGEIVSSTSHLARISKSVQISNDYSVLIFVNSKNIIRGIQEIPNGLLKQDKDFMNYLRGRMYEFGSSNAFMVASNEEAKNIAVGHVKKGFLLDAILTDKNYNVTSVREDGLVPEKSGNWLGKSLNKGLRVMEVGANL